MYLMTWEGEVLSVKLNGEEQGFFPSVQLTRTARTTKIHSVGIQIVSLARASSELCLLGTLVQWVRNRRTRNSSDICLGSQGRLQKG